MKTLRRFGLGDLQHVRYHLLGVAYAGTRHATEVAQLAYAAGTALRMMTRLHVSANLSPASRRAVFDIFERNQYHQLEVWETEAEMRRALLGSDLIVQDETSYPLVVEIEGDRQGIDLLGAWKGRPLNGNFGGIGRAQLRSTYPGMIAELA